MARKFNSWKDKKGTAELDLHHNSTTQISASVAREGNPQVKQTFKSSKSWSKSSLAMKKLILCNNVTRMAKLLYSKWMKSWISQTLRHPKVKQIIDSSKFVNAFYSKKKQWISWNLTHESVKVSTAWKMNDKVKLMQEWKIRRLYESSFAEIAFLLVVTYLKLP